MFPKLFDFPVCLTEEVWKNSLAFFHYGAPERQVSYNCAMRCRHWIKQSGVDANESKIWPHLFYMNLFPNQ